MLGRLGLFFDRCTRLAWPVLFGFLAVSPSAARAGNEDELFVGNQAAMVGGSIAAVVKDASSTWYNPAGLGAVERDQVDVSATVYTLRLYSSPKFISAVTGESDDGAVTEFVVAPSQIAYVRRFKEGLALGLGYFMPRSSNYVLRESLSAGRSAERSEWQIAASIAEAQHIGAAALGYSVSPRIRVGASLIGGYVASTQSFSLFGSASQDRQPVAAAATTVIGTTSRISLQLGLGMQLDLTDAVALGITLRGPEVMLHDAADSSANATVASRVDPAMPVLGTAQQQIEDSHGVDVIKAGRAGLSIAYQFARGWVSAEIDIQPKLRREAIEVDRRTTLNGRLGFYYAFLPSVAFGVGLFTDRSPEAKKWDFVSGSGDFYGATLGLELSNEHVLAPTEAVKSLVFTSVFALRYAYSDGSFGRTVVDPSQLGNGELISEEDAAFVARKGSLSVHEIGLYVGSGLRF
jgi:opacity protein-like surface antigen